MTQVKTTERVRVAHVIARYGRCLELVTMDSSFHNISVGLYENGGVCTVWTYSQKPGVQIRIEQIRDRLVELGGLVPVDGTHNQVTFPCGYLHLKPIKFLITQAVGKAREYAQPKGDMSIKDTKSQLILSVSGREQDGKWVYGVSGEGEISNKSVRLRMVIAGFLRYGEMEKVGDAEVEFPCGQRHDQLMRVLLPYSRNVSGVESMIDAEAMRGQMTTNTLGFTPPT